MYYELSTLGEQTPTTETIQKYIFAVAAANLDGIVVWPQFLPLAKDLLNDTKIIAPIDIPFGLSESSVRNHAVLSCIKKGANTIDLMLNPVLLRVDKVDPLIKDLESNIAICRKYNVDLRLCTEYRIYDNADEVFHTLELAKQIGINICIPATGTRLDDLNDNIIMCSIIRRYGLESICSAHVKNKDDVELIKKSNIYGIRFNSIQILKPIFGVSL